MYTKLTETGLLLSRSENDALISFASTRIFDQSSNTTIHVLDGGRWLREFMNIRRQKQGNSGDVNKEIVEQLPDFLKGVWFVSVRYSQGHSGDMYELTDIRSVDEAHVLALQVESIYNRVNRRQITAEI
jgi:hypothetical protein